MTFSFLFKKHSEGSRSVKRKFQGATLNKFGDGEGGGAPMRTESGQIKTTRPITLRADERGGKDIRPFCMIRNIVLSCMLLYVFSCSKVKQTF
jgi:hypothetical protein